MKGTAWSLCSVLVLLPHFLSFLSPEPIMGSSSHRRRRERRFRRYLSTGRLSKAQSLFKRHPRLDIDAGEPPLLHRACACHDASALRLLLRLGADPTHQDCHGNTALHAAAQQGPSGDEDATLDTPEPESFSAWTERLAREHAQKQQQQQATKRARHPECMSASQCSWQQQEVERRLFRERAQAKEEELRESRARRTQEDRGHCGGHRNRTKPRGDFPKGGDRLWCFKDIPWPCPGGRDPEAMAAALVARGPPPTDQGALRKYLRAQQVQWHPDRFLQRFGCQIEAREREKILEIVTALSQALNRHAEGLK
ncbi:NF-kappa-B inhibitor-like protein 1 isoform X3 [Vombatus ursinus]|uniref:NF-kappa-B inhibitor-like protein 1 isoform X3 n=1 Tax=Vombatus ursinus TaxID=29139 RepID=UPI000FFD3C50|nr:NF-kappa-B inhibitor-like protein 1 isoform X3 [Vombatus ursinus]